MLLDASLPTTETVGHFFERRADGSVKDSVEGWDTSDEMFTVASLVDDLDEGDNQEDVLDNFHGWYWLSLYPFQFRYRLCGLRC